MPLLFALLIASLPLSAEWIRFDPAAPTTETFVSMRIAGSWPLGCTPANPQVSRAGNVTIVRLEVVGECARQLPAVQNFSLEAPLGLLPAGETVVVVEAWEKSERTELARTPLYVRSAPPIVGSRRVEVEPQVVFPGQPPIAIRAEGIGGCPPLADPCFEADVRFNGVPHVGISHVSQDEIVVTPPLFGAAKVVDVEITARNWKVTLPGAIRVADGSEYDPSLFERLLVPVIYNGPGSHGSQWRTEVWMHNLSNGLIPMFRTPDQLIGCVPGQCDAPMMPDETKKLPLDDAPGGWFIHVARGSADDLAVNVLFRDMTRQATALGAEMPVVRESELLRRRSALLNVPTEQKYRIALRAYSLSEFPVTLMFRVYDMNGTLLLENGSIFLSNGGEVSPQSGIIADLADRYPELGGTGPFRIEFEPLTNASDDRYWAFASITNNETQHVTLITPQ